MSMSVDTGEDKEDEMGDPESKATPDQNLMPCSCWIERDRRCRLAVCSWDRFKDSQH